VSVPPPSSSDPFEKPAELAWRAGARIVDVIAFTWLSAFVLVELDQRLFGGDPLGRRPGRLVFDSQHSISLAILLAVAYETLPMVLHGSTLGKAMLGVRVRSLTGKNPSGWSAATRTMAVYLPPIMWGWPGLLVAVVLALSAAFPASGRGIHDRLAATVVVTMAERVPDDGSAGDGELA